MSKREAVRLSESRCTVPKAWLRWDVLLGSLVINLLALALPIVILQTYDRIIPQHANATFSMLMIAMVGVVVLDALIRSLRSFILSWEGARFDHWESMRAMAHILDTDSTAFSSKPKGYYLDKMRALEQIQEFFSAQSILIMIDFPFVLIFLALIGVITGPLVLVPVTLLAIFLIASVVTGRHLQKALKMRSDVEDRRQNFIIETLQGIHTLKSMAMEALMLRRFERLQSQSARSVFELSRITSIVQGIGATLSQLATISFVSAGSFLVVNGEITIGALAAGSMLSGRVLQPVLRAMGVWTQFQSVRLARKKVEELFAMPAETTGSWRPRLGIQGKIELRGVDFGYSAQQSKLLTGINLTVHAGEMIAITGSNGVGKSTLISLLAGFIHPDRGEILVDDRSIEDFDIEYLRSRIGIIPQQGVLFEGTILENMTLYREGEAVSQAIELSRWLGLEEVVSKLPDGLDTKVSGGAVATLPEGVRQKIVIVRSLVGNPQIVLFDDANASLDIKNDQRLMRLIMRLKGERTMVVVSHRPSFLAMADRQFELVEGRLVPVDSDQPRRGSQAERAPVSDLRRSTG